jgi:hypothetical protein
MPRYSFYTTGTVTATNGSRTVTGVNTAWLVASTQEYQIVGGDFLRIGNQRPIMIDTVDSPTQVTLVETWPHSTASASAYTVVRFSSPPEARVLGALETLAQRGSSASPFERITFDSGGVRFQMRDDGSGLVGLYIGATSTADGSLALVETINRTTLARILRGPLSWTGTTYMGLLIQSLTTTQRDALLSPGDGGVIYNSTDNRHQYRAGGAWREAVRRSGDAVTGPIEFPLGSAAAPPVTFTGDTDTGMWSPAANTLAWSANGVEGMRLTSSRRLAVGVTASQYQAVFSRGAESPAWPVTVTTPTVMISGTPGDNTALGVEAFGAGAPRLTMRRALGDTTTPTALASSSAMFGFVGIGYGTTGWSSTARIEILGRAAEAWTDTAQGTEWIFRTTANGTTTQSDRLTITNAGSILPGADNTQNLGSGSLRMATIFAGTGTINTSDAREKQDILPITNALLDKWAGVEAISFKFKGRNRTHFGYTAQQVLEVMGADAWTYALLCKDQITKPIKRMVKTQIPKTETKTISEETIKIKDGVPTVVVETREVQEPVVEMVQVIGADGSPVMIEVPTGIMLLTDPPKPQTRLVPRLHPVPVMVESEVEETVDEPAGDRLGLRYDQCAVIEAAWARRELSRALERIAALEAA